MTDARNPYAPPTTHVSDPSEQFSSGEGESLIPDGRMLPPGRGFAWLGDAWRLFFARPGKWLLNLVLFFLIYFVASVIPILGNLLSLFIWPFLSAAIVWAVDQQRRTGTFDVTTLFDGIRAHTSALLVIGAVFFGAMLVFFFAMFAVFGFALIKQMMQQPTDPAIASQLLASFGWAILIYAVIVLPVAAATYFAPALIVLHKLPATTALKMSLNGSVKNILAGLVFAICSFLMLFIAVIPIGLGLLVAVPVLMISTYTAYRDIFVESAA